MSQTETRLTILLDEGAPVPAGEPFSSRGHHVIQHAQVLAKGARDKDVVAAAIANSAILLATDADMKGLARRFGGPNLSEHYPELNLIFLSCGEVQAQKRLQGVMDFIEHEWAFAVEKKARRLFIDVGLHRLTTYR